MRDGDAAGREPGTEAGRRLYETLSAAGMAGMHTAYSIWAVEAEARQQGRDRAGFTIAEMVQWVSDVNSQRGETRRLSADGDSPGGAE